MNLKKQDSEKKRPSEGIFTPDIRNSNNTNNLFAKPKGRSYHTDCLDLMIFNLEYNNSSSSRNSGSSRSLDNRGTDAPDQKKSHNL